MSTIKAVIFDMDGLLINSEPIYQTARAEGVAHFGYAISEAFNRSLLGVSVADEEAMMVRELGDDFPMQTFREQWPARWESTARREGIVPMAGALELLNRLAAHGVCMGIATSTARSKAKRCLAAAGIDHAFAAMVCGPEVENGKPAADIYLAAAAAVDCEPQHCVALEDSNNGMRSALDAGMTAIMVPDLKDAEADVAQRAHYIVDDLVQAAAIVETLLGLPCA